MAETKTTAKTARKPAEKPAVKKTAAKAAKKPVAKKAAAKSVAKSVAKKPAKAPTARRKKPRYTKDEFHAIFARFHEVNPEPEGELDYTNPFTLLVAVALSAQATDVGVNRATANLFKMVSTPQEMVDLGEDRLRDEIKTIGLFRNKAKNAIAMSKMLVENFGGEVPQTREELETLAGVGRKTANVVLNIAFGQPTIAVDTHLFRIGNRLGIAPGKNPLEVEKALEKIIPDEFRQHAHHWLILHGRYICKARTPDCGRCVIADLCKSPEKTV